MQSEILLYGELRLEPFSLTLFCGPLLDGHSLVVMKVLQLACVLLESRFLLLCGLELVH